MKEDIGDNDRSGSPRSNEYLLVREITHRINNEFASVIGFVSVLNAGSSSAEVKAVLAQVAGLLHKYSGAHRALEMPTYSTVVDASCYLRALCQSIRIAKLDYRDIELVLVEYPLRMHSERCWKLGMIASELITNSARHAFHDRGGIIRITLSESGSFARCCVTDNGSSRLPPTSGDGLKIVEALAKELGGTIVHRFGAEGAVSVLLFPIEFETLKVDSGISECDQDRCETAISPRSIYNDRDAVNEN